jgi:hypothetical protein
MTEPESMAERRDHITELNTARAEGAQAERNRIAQETTGLETAVRAALTQYRHRYRQLPIPAADDEATTAILAACRAYADDALAKDRAQAGRDLAARPRTTRPARPRPAK